MENQKDNLSAKKTVYVFPKDSFSPSKPLSHVRISNRRQLTFEELSRKKVKVDLTDVINLAMEKLEKSQTEEERIIDYFMTQFMQFPESDTIVIPQLEIS